MQCQCIAQFGQPLVADTRPDMEPQCSEVILEVVAAGVCHTDLHVREGHVDLGNGQKMNYGDRGVSLPRILGHETVGRVVAAGPEAEGIDRTKTYILYPWAGCGTCAVCATGAENLCATPRFLGIHVDGGYASQIRVAHPRYLFDIGDLDPQTAAPLACSGLTTYAALKKLGTAPAEQPAVLIGAGGLGLTCLQLMLAQGLMPPVMVDIDPAKREAALAGGAAAAVDPRAGDAAHAIRAACGGAPSAVIDFVGDEPTAKLGFDLLARGGTLVLVGLFGGSAPFSLPLITLKTARIEGSYVGTMGDFAELLELARRGAFQAIPMTGFPLAEAEAVLNRLEAGEIIGRAVLAPA